MNPSLSVIAFTVLSGAGFGLITLTVLFNLFGAGMALSTVEVLTAGVLGFVLASAGLLASTLHLANPKNAWRAFFRFRTSWLSREGVFSVLFYPFVLAYLVGLWATGAANGLIAAAGLIAALLAMVTVFCTGMIYASLRTIPQWNNSLVPTNYLLMSLASGGVLLTTVLALFRGGAGGMAAVLTLVLLVIAAIGKVVYYFWIGKPQGPSINTAVGMTRGQVRLLEAGQSARSFLDKEFGFEASSRTLGRLRLVVYAVAFTLPIVIIALLLRSQTAPLAVLALVATLVGLFVERWLFFAEARHVVNLFYGRQRC